MKVTPAEAARLAVWYRRIAADYEHAVQQARHGDAAWQNSWQLNRQAAVARRTAAKYDALAHRGRVRP